MLRQWTAADYEFRRDVARRRTPFGLRAAYPSFISHITRLILPGLACRGKIHADSSRDHDRPEAGIHCRRR
jgi:hypothetical protein